MKYLRYFSLVIGPLLFALAAPASSEVPRNMQFSLLGFKGKHVVIRIKEKKIIAFELNDDMQFFFAPVDDQADFDIIVDRYHQHEILKINSNVKSVRVIFGRPVKIEALDHFQGID